jgi:aminopeptidase N
MKGILKLMPGLILILFIGCPLEGNDGYRRNLKINVLDYSFSVALNDTNNVICGRAVITVGFLDNCPDVKFDLKDRGSDGKGMIIDSVLCSEGPVEWIHKENKIIINPSIPFRSGVTGKITIIYHGIPGDGLIISNNKFGRRTFFSDHWPDRASNYLPCIDHPYDKATVEFKIIAPEHYVVVANGYLVEESHAAAGYKLTRWREDVPIPVKVMAFGAADFDLQLAGLPLNIPVWTYVFTRNREAGFYDYSVAVKPITFFSNLIGPYPFEKLANVQSKTIFGGLENAGCVFYSENSVTGKGRAESLLAHEIAHQWFGNSVTESDWHDIWLSEGFATYLEAVYEEHTYGEDKFHEVMKSARERVLRQFIRSPGAVIDTTITDLMKLLSAYTYQKGAWILHMLRHELGEEKFWKGIRMFYERYKGLNAKTGDFINVMEEVSGKNLGSFFTQWLYLKGEPDLKITAQPSRKKGDTDIIIEQKQVDLYSFPLELLIKTPGSSIIKKIQIKERITKLTLRSQTVNEIIPDPDFDLLFRAVNS